MPGARVVKMVVARDPAVAVIPTAMSPMPAMNSPTASAFSPRVPPFSSSAIVVRIAPPSHIQKPDAARRGNAMARAPSWIGTMATHAPITSGSSVANTSPTRWASMSWAMICEPSTVSVPSMRSTLSITLITTEATRPSVPPAR